MNVAQVIAEVMKREGCEYLLAYPLNPLTESCAAAGIRPIIVRQERIAGHMADAISRLTSGEKVGVFCHAVRPWRRERLRRRRAGLSRKACRWS